VTATLVADSTKSASAPVLVGGAGSSLAQAAAQATPGQWFHFTGAENSSFGSGKVLNLPSGASDNATTWSTKGMWNPVTKEYVFVGGAHCGSGASGCPSNMVTVSYNDTTGNWSTVSAEGTHTYQGATLNTSAGSNNNVYFRPFNDNNVQVFSLASHSWSGSIASVPSIGLDCCLAMEYFPDRNSLITIDNDWGIYEYSFASGNWSGCLIGTATASSCPNGTHAFCGSSSTAAPWAFYDSKHHQMLVGGCSNVYSLATNMAITQLASAPFDISVGTSASPASYDPSTGKLMSWDTSGNTFTFDGTAWTNVGKSPFSDPVNGGLACAPVSTYNVVMCIYAGASGAPVSGAAVWIYRGQ
jgi:hypothetical protein